MIYYTLKVDIMHVRWDPLDRFFNLVKVDNFCTVEHHTLTHVNCWQKIPSYALEWSHFCIEKIFCPFFRIPCEAEEVAEKTDLCHASSKTQTERKRRVDEKREKCYIFTLDANWKTTLSCQPENWRIPACGDIEDYSISI